MALSGGRVFISPRAQCTYYVRENPSELFRQFFHYGYYRVVVLRKHRLAISLRHFAPITLFSVMGILLLGCFSLPGWWALLGCVLPLMYFLILLLGGILVAGKEGIGVGLVFPITAFIMHFSYAVGFGWAIMKEKIRR